MICCNIIMNNMTQINDLIHKKLLQGKTIHLLKNALEILENNENLNFYSDDTLILNLEKFLSKVEYHINPKKNTLEHSKIKCIVCGGLYRFNKKDSHNHTKRHLNSMIIPVTLQRGIFKININ